MLHVQVKVTRANGNDLDAAEPVGPVNNWLHSLWSQVDLSLNGTLVTASSNSYAYRAYIETMLSYGFDAKSTQLTNQLWYKDKSSRMNAVELVRYPPNPSSPNSQKTSSPGATRACSPRPARFGRTRGTVWLATTTETATPSSVSIWPPTSATVPASIWCKRATCAYNFISEKCFGPPWTSSPTPNSSPCWKSTRTATSSTTTEMDTLQIARLLAMDPNTASVFGGVVAKDGLPKKIDALPIAFVCNTDDGDEPGEHWIALYLSSDGLGEYFCSYGLPPRHATFRAFLNKHCSEWTHNSKRLQSPLSNVCGQYCVAYIMLRCKGSPMRTFVNAFHTDLVANDCRVFDWIKLLKKGIPYYRISYINWLSRVRLD